MICVGDCVEVMADMAEATVDAVVTDPPYHLSFMGKAWDHMPTPRESQTEHRLLPQVVQDAASGLTRNCEHRSPTRRARRWPGWP